MSLEPQEFQERPAEPHRPPNDPLNAAGSLVNYELFSEDQADCCPYCRRPLEILFVKFRIGGTAIVASCANCGIARADEWRAAESKTLDNAKKLARNTRGLWRGLASRYVLTFLLGAVITAAALRHSVHVYGGISPEEIRAGALMAIPAVALAIIFFRRKRQR
jgi:hypothetical protein